MTPVSPRPGGSRGGGGRGRAGGRRGGGGPGGAGGRGGRGRARPRLEPAAWWVVRPAHNRKPATYRCPLCGGLLPALREHMLILPEGDAGRRRHAHTACVLAARQAGRLPLRDEVDRPGPSLWSRILDRLRRRGR